jgi:hypothetical protein
MEPESFEDRLIREREERKRESGKREVIRSAGTGSRPTSRAGREEASQRFKELMSPASTPSSVKAPQAPAGGEAIDFYVWKDGAVGKLKILTEGEFEAIE